MVESDYSISVIVPVYNAQDYIEKCILSLLEQTKAFYEIILVDDGSTDESGSICDRYAMNNSTITVIHKANGGLVSARQAGAEIATGKYCVCLDCDDWLDNTFVTESELLIGKYDPDIICYGYKIVGNSIKTVSRPECFYENRKAIVEKIYPELLYGYSNIKRPIPLNIWAKVYKRDQYLPIQMTINPMIKINEDMACVVPYVVNCNSVYVSNKTMYYYRYNKSSMTKQRKPLPLNGPELIYEHYQRCLESVNLEFEEQIYRQICHSLFNVLVSQFYSNNGYRETKRLIKSVLSKDVFKNIINKAKFGEIRRSFMRFVLQHQLVFLMYLKSVWKKAR